ncbi:hypothetical protein OG559_26205 [Micromonospora sp. NBC_01405]|uniref:hypothetical protein n=1 Tax=Micromonospora sp. NBC_01405 TaxID=2903589 RepID=UPI00324D197E
MIGHLDDDRLRAFGRPARITVWPAGDALLQVGNAETLLRIVERDGCFAVEKQDRGGAWHPQMSAGSLAVARRYVIGEIGSWVRAFVERGQRGPSPDEPLRDGFTLTDLGPSGLVLSWREASGERSARFPPGRWRGKAVRFARYADLSEESIVRRFGGTGATPDALPPGTTAPADADAEEQRMAAREIVRLVRRELPAGADRLTMRAGVLATVDSCRWWAAWGERREEIHPPDDPALRDALHASRRASYRPGLGTWFGLELTVTSTGDVTMRFDHDDEPVWWSEPVDPTAYVAEQRCFPREETHQPPWLRQRLAQGRAQLPQRLIERGTELFGRIAPGAELVHHLLPEDDAVLVVRPVRGGGSIYVAHDGSVMFAVSAVPPHQALELFRSGRRTPAEQFVAPRKDPHAGGRAAGR